MCCRRDTKIVGVALLDVAVVVITSLLVVFLQRLDPKSSQVFVRIGQVFVRTDWLVSVDLSFRLSCFYLNNLKFG